MITSVFRHCFLLGVIAAGLSIPLAAQSPELSAEEPIAYSEETGMLIATGNAVFVDENTRVEADEIRYNRNESSIIATGNVRVTRTGLRLLADTITYNATTRAFSAENFRAGYPPLFVEGTQFSGNLDQVDFARASVYFREPVQSAPRLDVASGTWLSGKSLSGSGIRLKALGPVRLPLPGFSYTFGSPRIEVDASLGYSSNLGAYLRSHWLFPFRENLSAGGNLDLYTQRGVLVGPAFTYETPGQGIRFSLNSGWIRDQDPDERGLDRIGRPVPDDRAFLITGLQLHSDDTSLQLNSAARVLTDSEFLRDFRPSLYDDLYQAESFAEFTWQKSSLLVNALVRGQLNDYHGMVDRLPELSAELLPTKHEASGLVLQAQAKATRYRLISAVSPLLDPDAIFQTSPPLQTLQATSGPYLNAGPYINRIGGSATLTRPIFLPSGFCLTPRAGILGAYWDQAATRDQPSASWDRFLSELGFDLTRDVARTFTFDESIWGMQTVRHWSRLGISTRWHADLDDTFEGNPLLDVAYYRPSPDPMDLADLEHPDFLEDRTFTRLSWENTFTATFEDGRQREVLALNLYQDISFHGSEQTDDLEATYLQADLSPASWLKIHLRQKVRTEDTQLEASLVGLTLRSSDIWAASFLAEYLEGAIDNYRFSGTYRLTENLGLITELQYDARLDSWVRQRYGFTRRFGNVWEMETYASFTDANQRDADFSVGLRLRWLAF